MQWRGKPTYIKEKMKEIILSTLTGGICGVVFALLKLPVPAPPVLSGVMGIVGLWIGYTLIHNL
jgi:XapX domain-containing protein